MSNKFFKIQRTKTQLKRLVPVPFVLGGLILFVLTAMNAPVVISLKTKLMEFMAPVIFVVSYPVQFAQDKMESVSSFFNVYEENKQLKKENEILKSWQKLAFKLVVDQKELSQLLNYKPVAQGREYVVRILADYNSPFSQSVIINGGINIGVKKGDVLVTNNGLLGHVIEVGSTTARAIKVTDFYSRLPVLVGMERVECMLTGDNSQYPKLTSLPEETHIEVGDFVMTSGNAGVYPSGIPIGRVLSVDNGEYVIELFEKSQNLEFVRAIDFNLTGLLPSELPCQCGEQN